MIPVNDRTRFIVNALVDILKQYDVSTVLEILDVYSCLGYTLGQSIADLPQGIGLDYDILKQLYLQEEDVGAALILQSLNVQTWITILKDKKKRRSTKDNDSKE